MVDSHNSLLYIGLCKEYGLDKEFDDKAVLVNIGSALSSALNDGYGLGIKRKPALVNIDGLTTKYNLKEIVPAVHVGFVNKALYQAFLEGYRQAKCMIEFEETCLSEGNKIAKDLMSIMKRHAKPEDIVFINYLTNKKEDEE